MRVLYLNKNREAGKQNNKQGKFPSPCTDHDTTLGSLHDIYIEIATSVFLAISGFAELKASR